MVAARYDMNRFTELGEILREFRLDAQILPDEQQVEISDKYGNRIKKRFSELLMGKEGCVVCVRKIADHFEKLAFRSMRGAGN